MTISKGDYLFLYSRFVRCYCSWSNHFYFFSDMILILVIFYIYFYNVLFTVIKQAIMNITVNIDRSMIKYIKLVNKDLIMALIQEFISYTLRNAIVRYTQDPIITMYSNILIDGENIRWSMYIHIMRDSIKAV